MEIRNKRKNSFLSLTAIVTLGSVLFIGWQASASEKAQFDRREYLVSFLEKNTIDWKKYRSVEGKYSVSMPGKIEERTQAIPVDGMGSLRQKIAVSASRNSAYFVSHTDYPKAYTDLIAGQENFINELLSESIKATLTGMINSSDSVKEESIEVDNILCKKFESPITISGLNGETKGINCWHDNRLYQVLVVGTIADVEENADRFLDSFTIQK